MAEDGGRLPALAPLPHALSREPRHRRGAGRGEAVVAKARADAAVEALEAEVCRRLERFVFDREGRSFAESLLVLLRGAGARVAVAESCTGDRRADLLRAAGSSAVFDLGVVAYADRISASCSAYRRRSLAEHGAVSQACAEAMARGVRERARADFGVAITGVAGPGGAASGKPVGTVHFAVAGRRWRRASAAPPPYDRARTSWERLMALWLLRARLRGEPAVATATIPAAGRWA
ncbi:MAG: nicotinamide-nucleotide amidohydrolase family protein [Proteobacteria bacterium]|nr:nicotinamide-nucleotide amidohydrolase family protein [Pseudomonadota bacterium]